MTTESPKPFEWNYCPICGDRLVQRPDSEKERPHCLSCRRFYYRNPTPAVCCLLNRNDEILFAQRAVEPCIGQWTLPGGFIELGETSEEAAVREMYEETGLVVKDLRLLGVSTQQSRYYGAVTVLGYVVGAWSGDTRPDSDALDLRFFSRQQRPWIPFTAHTEILALFDAEQGG